MIRDCQGWLTAEFVLRTAGGIWAEDPSEKAARYPRLSFSSGRAMRCSTSDFNDPWLDEGTKEGLEEVQRGGVRGGRIQGAVDPRDLPPAGGRDEETGLGAGARNEWLGRPI
jgi:hypothetical protein